MMTPELPLWPTSGRLAQQCRRRFTPAQSLHQFETLFRHWLPHWRLAQQDQGPHSRQRRWPLRLVFWTFAWQIAQAGASCREAIRQAQALCQLNNQPVPPDGSSAYCQARGALPLDRLDEIQNALVRESDAATAPRDLWCGHRVYVVDGTTLTAPDTPANQRAFPQQSVQKPGCGWPIVRLVGLLSLSTGLLAFWVIGHWRDSEAGLFQKLWEQLSPGHVLLGDRGFCNWGLLAQAAARQLHAVLRVKGSARRDFRRGKRLSRHERLVQWRKPSQRAVTISPAEWALLPAVLTLRVVRCRIDRAGFRTREVRLVTTLLDSTAYPPAQLSQLYYRRWSMELSFRQLKSTLQMDHLSCLNPHNLQREIHLHLLVYNLVRRLMLESARTHRVPLERISFAGSLAAARRYSEALLQIRTQRHRRQLWEELLRVIAEDLVPDRPGRREPRAIKRRPKPYPRLMQHRHILRRELSHQNRYYHNSPFGPKYRTNRES